jgi:hypothetical protein
MSTTESTALIGTSQQPQPQQLSPSSTNNNNISNTNNAVESDFQAASATLYGKTWHHLLFSFTAGFVPLFIQHSIVLEV